MLIEPDRDRDRTGEGVPDPAPPAAPALPIVETWDAVPPFADEQACGAFWLGHEAGPFLFEAVGPPELEVDPDIDRVYRQIHDINRFLQPGVIVVDYSMPQMDGLEFCQALQDLPCKTILLTGTADESIAVQGFNHGLIDRYVKKHDSNMVERLDQEIEAMQQAYFATLSRTLRELPTRHSFSFLSDPAMTERVW